MSVERVFVALGANLGEPLVALGRALEVLHALEHVDVVGASNAHRTEAFETPTPQPDYWNAVCELRVACSPRRLLLSTQGVERRFGRDREREGHRGARALDLDLVLFGEREVRTTRLTIPHPELERRLFVVEPLAELVPDLVLPSGVPAARRARELAREGQRVLERRSLAFCASAHRSVPAPQP